MFPIQETILDSDHALLIANVHFKLARKKRDKRKPLMQKYGTPTQNQKHACHNLLVERKMEEQRQLGNWNCAMAFDTLADILSESADKHFTHIPFEQKKPYLSEITWNLLEA